MDVLFLDANILYSAARSPDSPMRAFWRFTDVRLITSAYAVNETQRNLPTPDMREALASLLTNVTIVDDVPASGNELFSTVSLVEKDRPILLAAIHANATHLITGDVRHFGAYYGQRISGVLILNPAACRQARGATSTSP